MNKNGEKYRAVTRHCIGTFKTKEEAGIAYDRFEEEAGIAYDRFVVDKNTAQ